MANPLGVDSRVTDAVTQTNVKVVAESPAAALSVVYQLLSQAVGLSMQNSSNQQQAMQQISTATVTVAVKMILSAAGEGGKSVPGV
ncbi:killing trait domain-containing protein [Archangium gephyra]|uniref:Killing trait domain-containing protein n=1 Tax=Archangium gephyra TaxID=48 RepID=A0AAC8TC30_9BACT|nr:RebB family R body protein [Archangium gephyra]AKJ00542.1 R body protein, putative [Archangium gephyra]REG32763.1 killing trait domain-containing protein [Archangium gephyra]